MIEPNDPIVIESAANGFMVRKSVPRQHKDVPISEHLVFNGNVELIEFLNTHFDKKEDAPKSALIESMEMAEKYPPPRSCLECRHYIPAENNGYLMDERSVCLRHILGFEENTTLSEFIKKAEECEGYESK